MYISTTGIGVVDSRADLGPDARADRRPRAAVRADRQSWHGDHDCPGRPRHRSRHSLRYASVDRAGRCRCSMSAGQGVEWMRDATRGGVATVLNELARDAELPIAIARGSRSGRRRRARRLRIAGARSAARRQRRPIHRHRRGRLCRRRAARPCGRRPAASGPAISAKSPQGRLARVVAKAVVRRRARRRHADRRSAAADLLVLRSPTSPTMLVQSDLTARIRSLLLRE